MYFHTGTNEGGIDLAWCLWVLSAAAIPSCQDLTQSSFQRGKKSIEEHLFYSKGKNKKKKREVKWPQPSNRSWLSWNRNLVLFRKSRSDSRALSFPHFHEVFPTQQALEDQVAANTSRAASSCTGLLWRGTFRFPKVTRNFRRVADTMPVLLPSQNPSAICSIQRICFTNSQFLEWAFQQQLGIQILGEVLASEVWLSVP